MILPNLEATLWPALRRRTMTESSWSFEAVQSLISLAREGVPVSIISLKLKRSSAEVRAKLNDLGVTPPAET
jgi:hypothetical protein